MTFKKVNPKESLFHYIDIGQGKYVLFDSELDIPIIRGRKNVVGLTIKKLTKNVVIHYYKLEQGQIQHSMS